MASKDDPIKRLRTALGLKQEPFGALFGVGQSSVSDWERGAPLSPEKAVLVWNGHGPRLRRMGVRFDSLLLPRSGWTPRDRSKAEGSGAAA